MTIIYFILILGIIVCIHEFGHFLFAKKAGIYVYEFSIGMGPRLFKWNRKNDETVYSIRLLPIGGFVQMAGEDLDTDEKSEIPKDKMMQNKKWYQRFLTIVAGVMFNFILAIILLFVIALIHGAPYLGTTIGEVGENSPAAVAGLETGDRIIKVGNKKVTNSDMLMLELQVQNGKETTLVVEKKDGKTRKIIMSPKKITVDGKESYQYGFALETKAEKGIIGAVKYAFGKTISLVEQMVHIIGYLFTGKLALSSLAGPVGIFQVVGETAKTGILNMIYLIAFMSINVGFLNLLPIPAFDGGRLLFLIIEKIKRSPVSPKLENAIHSIGFILLMILMVVITYNDILRLFH
ncbi:MAG: RIP metalloprotease RseP [Bacilli bacterium]|nr:RIP metalloprotease RseP [Bacilli bacterium]